MEPSSIISAATVVAAIVGATPAAITIATAGATPTAGIGIPITAGEGS